MAPLHVSAQAVGACYVRRPVDDSGPAGDGVLLGFRREPLGACVTA